MPLYKQARQLMGVALRGRTQVNERTGVSYSYELCFPVRFVTNIGSISKFRVDVIRY